MRQSCSFVSAHLGIEDETHGEEDQTLVSLIYEPGHVSGNIITKLVFLDLETSDIDEVWWLRSGVVQDVVSVDHHSAQVGQELLGCDLRVGRKVSGQYRV